MQMTKYSMQLKLYICSIAIILFAALLWIWYNYRYAPMRHTQAILELIEEGTSESLLNARLKAHGYEQVGSRRQRIEDHQPLRGRQAEAVKKSLLEILSTTDDTEVLRRTLSFLFGSILKPERSGIVINQEEEWRIVEEAAEKFNKSPDDNRHFRIVVTDDGKKTLAFGASLHHGDMPRAAVKD